MYRGLELPGSEAGVSEAGWAGPDWLWSLTLVECDKVGGGERGIVARESHECLVSPCVLVCLDGEDGRRELGQVDASTET